MYISRFTREAVKILWHTIDRQIPSFLLVGAGIIKKKKSKCTLVVILISVCFVKCINLIQLLFIRDVVLSETVLLWAPLVSLMDTSSFARDTCLICCDSKLNLNFFWPVITIKNRKMVSVSVDLSWGRIFSFHSRSYLDNKPKVISNLNYDKQKFVLTS